MPGLWRSTARWIQFVLTYHDVVSVWWTDEPAGTAERSVQMNTVWKVNLFRYVIMASGFHFVTKKVRHSHCRSWKMEIVIFMRHSCGRHFGTHSGPWNPSTDRGARSSTKERGLPLWQFHIEWVSIMLLQYRFTKMIDHNSDFKSISGVWGPADHFSVWSFCRSF